MTEDTTSSRPDIDWVRTIAGSMAAMASAVLLSTLGAAGTIIGAALGSLVVTVGSALFAHGLSKSKSKLAEAHASAAQKVGIARAEVHRAGRIDDTQAHDSHLEHADEQLAEAHEELDETKTEAAPVGWRARLAALPWKRIGITSLALFVVTIVVITVFELLAGRSVSSFTGGSSEDERTTIGNVGGSRSGQDDDQRQPDDEPTESPTPGESEDPTEEPTDSPSPTETAEPTPGEFTTPSDTPSPTVPEPTTP